MTTPTWRLKRGDDWTAPQDIAVTLEDVAVDLTDGWSITSQARYGTAQGDAVDFVVDEDTALLEAGKVRLGLTAEQTAAMATGEWLVDVQTDHADHGRKSSETWVLEVVADVTRGETP